MAGDAVQILWISSTLGDFRYPKSRNLGFEFSSLIVINQWFGRSASEIPSTENWSRNNNQQPKKSKRQQGNKRQKNSPLRKPLRFPCLDEFQRRFQIAHHIVGRGVVLRLPPGRCTVWPSLMISVPLLKHELGPAVEQQPLRIQSATPESGRWTIPWNSLLILVINQYPSAFLAIVGTCWYPINQYHHQHQPWSILSTIVNHHHRLSTIINIINIVNTYQPLPTAVHKY